MKASTIIISKALLTGLADKASEGALAIKDEKIIAVGSKDEILTYADQQTQIDDFGEALVIPGFHDSHIHVFHSALYSSPLALNYRGESEQDCVDALAPLAKRRPPDSWLLTQGWREYRWDIPKLPTKHSLDKVYPDRPVAMYSGDAHTLWVNSAALRKLKLDSSSVAPEGGSYERDEYGELTGIIRETAAMQLMPHILGSFSDEEIYGAYRDFLNSLVAQGITSVCDMALMPSPGLDFIRDDIYQKLESQQELPLRVHLFPTLISDMTRFETMKEAFTGSKLQTSGLKQFFDGVSSQHTAYLAKPYTNARYKDDRGHLSTPAETMRGLIMRAAEKGYPVRIHTIGDEAIHLALNYFEEARLRFGALRVGQNCLEHLENLQPDDIVRLAKLDVLAAVQPPHLTLDPGGPERDLGPERTPYMWPFKSFIDNGTKIAFGTDSPVVPTNPFNVLYAAITRQDPFSHEPVGGWLPSERISPIEALRAYTLGSACAAGRAHELGTLERGKLADITILDQNILTIDPDDIQDTRVLATYVGGNCVYRDRYNPS